MKNLNGVSLWQCNWHELFDFQLFADVSDSGINACIFQKKLCMQSFDQIYLKEKNQFKYMQYGTILLYVVCACLCI